MEPTPLSAVTGATRTLTLGGRQYTLSEINFGMEGDLQNWLESCALDALLTRRDKYGATFDDQLARLNDKINAFYFAFGGDGWLAAMNTPKGVCELLRLCLAPLHPGVTLAEVRFLYGRHQRELMMALFSLNPTHFPNAPPAEPGDPKAAPAGVNGAPELVPG